jgi:predicted MFS family arabinose efflux permease
MGLAAKITCDTARGRWLAAMLLFVLYVLHSVDRFVIGVVIEPIRHEFNFTDTELGAIGGVAHAIAYSACVLPVGWLLDRTNRVKLLSAMLAIWSLVTAVGALATGFWFLFLMRMGVGAAESASSPATQSLVASIFPLKQRAGAMGLVFSGTAVGTGLVFAVGGPVADHWGWRAVFLIAGLPGLLLAALMWFKLAEPPRSAERRSVDAPETMWRAARFFFTSRPAFFATMGSMIAAMNIASIWTWTAPILIREHGFSLATAGLVIGVAAGVLKFASSILSGFLGDIIARGRINRLWIVPSVALLLTVPIGFGLTMISSQIAAIALVLALGITMGAHYAAPKTIVMSVTPENMRGSVAAVEQLVINLVGVSIGPLVTGMISDYLGGDDSVSLAMAVTLSLNVFAGLAFWFSTRGIPDDAADGYAHAAPEADDLPEPIARTV